MALAPVTFDSLRRSVANKQLAPVYLLHGEEGYYIDALVKDFENILSEDEKVFNQYVLYAPETEPSKVMDLCRRIPMMAERQVVILKEAQAIRADALNKLHLYASSPTPTTVLVICCRGAAAKGKDLIAAVKKTGVIFESKKVRDSALPQLISQYAREKGLNTDQKATVMLAEYIGTDLSRLYNEIDKLATILGKGAAITPEAVERNIGISKEYNSFELVDALAAKDAARAFRIIAYFRSNPKAAPLVLTAASVFAFFADLLLVYYSKDRSERGIMETLGLKYPIQAKRYLTGMRSYNPFQIIEIIGAIRSFDVKSKGLGSRQNEHRLFYDLVYHILTAPGRI